MPSRRLFVAIASAVVFAVVILTAAACAVRGGRSAGLSNVLAPQLVLVSPPAGQISALSAMSLTVHTELPVAGGGRFLASASASNVGRMSAAGVSLQTLDADTRGMAYYLVEKDAGAEAPLIAMGRVVYEDDRQLLLALATRREADFLAASSALTPHIELIANDSAGLTSLRTAAVTAPPASPDPAIAALLPSITEAGLRDLVAALSGERSVTVGGQSVTLATRYSFSTQINNALLYVKESFARMGLAAQTAGWTYGRYSGSNVYADVKGEVHPERIWIIGAHLDDRSEKPQTRAPGADDNASGMAAMLSIADVVRQQRLRDTVRFIAFTGEEQGMWGSKSYARSLQADGVQVMGFIDLDMIAYDGNDDRVVELHSGSRAGSAALANAIAGANIRYGIGLEIEIKQESASRFSDHSPFWDAGYDAVLAIENFFADVRAADRNPWYHKTGDALERARLSYVERYARTALASVLELAGALHGPVPSATRSAVVTPTLTPTVTATQLPTATPTSALSPTPGSCRNVLLNGDMEAASGWTFGSTARPPAYVADPVAAGTRSLRTGILAPTADRAVYSSAYQRVAIPRNAVSATLVLRVKRGSDDSGGDRHEILLLNARLGALRTIERGLANDSEWQTVRFDLAAFAGQTVVVYVNTYNDGDGRRSWMFVDEAQVEVCTR